MGLVLLFTAAAVCVREMEREREYNIFITDQIQADIGKLAFIKEIGLYADDNFYPLTLNIHQYIGERNCQLSKPMFLVY